MFQNTEKSNLRNGFVGVSISVIKHLAKGNLERREFILPYNTRVGKQSRNWSSGHGRRLLPMRLRDCLHLLSYTSQPHWPDGGTTLSELTVTLENINRYVYRPILMRYFVSWCSPSETTLGFASIWQKTSQHRKGRIHLDYLCRSLSITQRTQ